MLVLLVVALDLLLLYWAWPRYLRWLIWHDADHAAHRGRVLLFCGAVWVSWLLYCILVGLDSKRTLLDAEPAVAALGVTAAVLFSYGKLFPPSFYAVWHRVDRDTGAASNTPVEELRLTPSRAEPAFLAVYNTGLISVKDYRINVSLPPGFEIHLEHADVPSSQSWSWKPSNVKIDPGLQWAQTGSVQFLAVGEPAALPFVVIGRTAPGRYEARVRIFAEPSLGETEQNLALRVLEDNPCDLVQHD